MRELYVSSSTMKKEDGMVLSCDYSVLIDQMKVREGFSCESYGVKVCLDGGAETTMIPNITASVSRIEELVDLLLRNTVTPCTLADVVSDWL